MILSGIFFVAERIPDEKIEQYVTSPRKWKEFVNAANKNSKENVTVNSRLVFSLTSPIKLPQKSSLKSPQKSPIKTPQKTQFKSPSNAVKQTKKRNRNDIKSPPNPDKLKQLSILSFFDKPAKRQKLDPDESKTDAVNENIEIENKKNQSKHDPELIDVDEIVVIDLVEDSKNETNNAEKNPIDLASDNQSEKSTLLISDDLTIPDHSISDTESNCSLVISNIRRLNELIGEVKFLPKLHSKSKKTAKKNRSDNEFTVEKILQMDEIDTKPYFFVKWKGYPRSANTWEPLANLKECNLLPVFLKGLTDQYSNKIADLSNEFQNKTVRPISVQEAFKLIENFDELQLESDLILLAMLKDTLTDENEATYKSVLNRIEENLDLLPFYVKRQEQLESLTNWESLINNADKSSNLMVENNVDFEGPPDDFRYINDNICGEGVTIPDDPLIGCECGELCYSRNQCCGKNSGSTFAYNDQKRIKVPPGTPVFECNKRCKCGPNCMNRVVQQGRKHSLAIFKTDNGRGWGVRTERTICEGQFICEYVGEVITYEETERRGQIYDAQGRTYLFDLDINSSDNPYTIDAAYVGNVSHFINHSCEPNCGVWAVWINCMDMDLPKICLFALRRIEAGEELNIDYLNPKVAAASSSSSADVGDSQHNLSNDEFKQTKRVFKNVDNMKCKCNSVNCRKYIF